MTTATTTASSELKLGFYADQAGVTQTLAAGTLDTTYALVTKDDNNGYSQTLIEEASSGASGSTARATATPPSGSPLWGMAVVVYKLGPPVTCPSGWSRVSGATRAANAHLPGSSWNAGSLGAAVAANDKLVAVVMTSNPTLVTSSSISDSLGNSWSKDLTPVTWTDGGWLGEMSVWSAVSAAGTPANITLSFSGSVDGVSLSVAAYRGLSTSSGTAGVDVSRIASGTGGGTNGASSGTTTATTTAASELKLGFYADQAGVTQTLGAGTLDTTYTLVTKDDNNSYSQTLIQEADSGASGSTARATATPPSGSPLWGMAVVVYKLAPPAGGGSDHFTLGYDGLERLTTIAGPVAETFTLDGGSNITARTGPAKTFSIDGSNRPTSDGTNTLSWNSADRLTGRGADSFGFDPLDRLTSSTVAGTSRTYAYSGDGLLQSRTQGGPTTTLLWDPATSPSRLLVSGSDRIVYGLGPLYSVNGTTVTTYARDGQKSIRAQLSGTSVTASWRYRAYGEIAQSSGAATPSLLGYAGQLLDPSGLYYMRARWYDAGSGRFLTRDPLGAKPSRPVAINAFAYAEANPAVLDDPTGRCAFLCGAIIGLGAYSITVLAINVGQGKGFSLEGWNVRDAAFATATGALTQGVSAFLAVRGATIATQIVTQGTISATSSVIQDVATTGDTDFVHEYVTTGTSTAAAFVPGGSAFVHAVAVGLTASSVSGAAGFGVESWIKDAWNQLVEDLRNALQP